jgi:hypothetical protein
MLFFRVSPKVFITLYHTICTTLCCYVMEIQMGDGLLIDHYNLCGCVCLILPWRIRDLDNMITFFLMCTWSVGGLLEGVLGILEEGIETQMA